MIRPLAFVIPLLLLALMDLVNTRMILENIDDYSLNYGFWGIIVIGYLALVLGIYSLRQPPLDRGIIKNLTVGLGFAIVVQKLVLFICSAIYGLLHTTGLVSLNPVVAIGLFLFSLIPLIAMVYGLIWGKYNFKVEKVSIHFDDLPAAFDGFKIVQISDVHSGTWDNIKGVEKGIKLIEDQAADMILFTGDLVNSNKDEIDPFIHLFQRLNAPYGKFAVLGNHDYYGQPRDQSLRPAYYEEFFSKFKTMGFDLILNDNRKIEKEADFLQLIGVENWGSGRFFPKRGDLKMATKNCQSGDFSILLSHDPSHWDMKALPFPYHFHLTLSGHTHGMQFGINLPFLKWSPVQYRYKQWMGLYEKANQFLYVNRGFGLLAFPGRVGMSPEITLIELRK